MAIILRAEMERFASDIDAKRNGAAASSFSAAAAAPSLPAQAAVVGSALPAMTRAP